MLGRQAILRHDHFDTAAHGQRLGEEAFEFGPADAEATAVQLQHIAPGLAIRRKAQAPATGQRGLERRLCGIPGASIDGGLHLLAPFGKVRRGSPALPLRREFDPAAHSAACCKASECSRLLAVRLAPRRLSSGMT